jgi:hypothetical protein
VFFVSILLISSLGSSLSVQYKNNFKAQSEDKKCAVILCGTAIHRVFDPFKIAFIKTTDHAYRALKHVGYKDKDIFYLSKHFGVGTDVFQIKKAFEYSIKNWLPSHCDSETECFIFMVDHGRDGGYFGLTKWNLLRDYEFADWLKDLEYKTLTIFINSCYSGDFIDDLSGPNRIIITSTNTTGKSFTNLADESVFPQAFFNELEKASDSYNPSYGKLWEEADKCIYSDKMNPQIDDNGDGIGSGTVEYDKLPLEGDGELALTISPYKDSDGINPNAISSIKKTKILLTKFKVTNLMEKLLQMSLFREKYR